MMNKTVYLVDDSVTILTSVSSMLERAGYTVRKASSAEEALRYFSQPNSSAHLLLTDLNMPGMNGIELIRAIRQITHHRFMPILFLTTESQMERKQEAKAAGASGWIVKPAKADALLQTVSLFVH